MPEPREGEVRFFIPEEFRSYEIGRPKETIYQRAYPFELFFKVIPLSNYEARLEPTKIVFIDDFQHNFTLSIPTFLNTTVWEFTKNKEPVDRRDYLERVMQEIARRLG